MRKGALLVPINKLLRRAGVLLIPSREGRVRQRLIEDYSLSSQDILRTKEALSSSGLRHYLLENNKTRWLEIGCGGALTEGFYCIDTYPEAIFDPVARSRYTRLDIVNARSADLTKLGKFDFIRMQHVFEHFTPEDGRRVLEHCGALLSGGGLLLITVPDLRLHAKTYLTTGYKQNPRMNAWNKGYAYRRISEDAPDSFHFAMFAHSLTFEKHLWCYDFEGLHYQLSKTGLYDIIEEIGLDHPFATFPFTHNRPEEDVCVLARRI